MRLLAVVAAVAAALLCLLDPTADAAYIGCTVDDDALAAAQTACGTSDLSVLARGDSFHSGSESVSLVCACVYARVCAFVRVCVLVNYSHTHPAWSAVLCQLVHQRNQRFDAKLRRH